MWQHTWLHKLDVDKETRPYLANALMYSEPVVTRLHDYLWDKVPDRPPGGEVSAARALPPYSG